MFKTESEIEEIYTKHERLVRATLKKQYPNYHDFAKLHGLEVDDLLQMGKIGLYKAIKDYDPTQNTLFKTYAINKISFALMTEPKLYSIRNENNRTYKLNGETSMDAIVEDQSDDSVNLHDMLEESNNPIEDAEMDILLDNIANKISPKLATAVKMKYENFTYKQIGERLNMSPQGVDNMIRKNKDKLTKLMLA